MKNIKINKRAWVSMLFSKETFILLAYFMQLFVGEDVEAFLKTLPIIGDLAKWMDPFPLLVSFVLPVIAIILFAKDIKESALTIKDNKGKYIAKVLIVYFVAIFVSSLYAAYRPMPETANQEIILQWLVSKNILFKIVFIGILPPILEEIIFRHIMIGKFSKKFNVYFLGITSGCFFALLHVADISELIAYIPITVMITMIYIEEDKSIIHSIGVHCVNNIVAAIVIGLA